MGLMSHSIGNFSTLHISAKRSNPGFREVYVLGLTSLAHRDVKELMPWPQGAFRAKATLYFNCIQPLHLGALPLP